MSNNRRTNAVGLDSSIQRVQDRVYDFLSGRWSGRLEGYGRAYKNIDKKGEFTYEWYSSTKKDYEDVYYNDSSEDVVFFFVESGTAQTEDNLSFNQDVKMITMCNLKQIVSNVTSERMDQEVHRDVVEGLRSANVTQINNVDTDIDTIFSGVQTKGIEFGNIHPLHCFSVTFSVNYYLNDKCN